MSDLHQKQDDLLEEFIQVAPELMSYAVFLLEYPQDARLTVVGLLQEIAHSDQKLPPREKLFTKLRAAACHRMSLDHGGRDVHLSDNKSGVLSCLSPCEQEIVRLHYDHRFSVETIAQMREYKPEDVIGVLDKAKQLGEHEIISELNQERRFDLTHANRLQLEEAIKEGPRKPIGMNERPYQSFRFFGIFWVIMTAAMIWVVLRDKILKLFGW